jgi:Starch-binding associating with outer membrane
MKKMKKISILALSILSLLNLSCDSEFKEVNTDPNEPQLVPAHLLLGQTIRETQRATYNVGTGGDMGSCWAQHWSKVQYNDEETYTPRLGTIEFLSDVLNTGVMYDSKAMYKVAEKEGNTNLQGISLIMQANCFQLLTDIYGPIPFTEAGIKNNLKPKYEEQKVVYEGIKDMLVKAEQLLELNNGEFPATSDLLFKGDITKWRKFGNSLLLKVLVRESKAPGINNVAKIQALVTKNNFMASNDDNAQVSNLLTAAEANPLGPSLTSRLEYKLSTVLIAKMNSFGDPRLPIYGKPVGGVYVGNIPGNESLDYAGKSGIGSFYTKNDLPGIILSYSQVQFLLAECANEGYIANPLVTATETQSEIYLRKGIEANFLFNGLTSASAALYSAKPIFDFTTKIDGRKVIGEQVWLSLYCQGLEAWTEWRRTGIPALNPVLNPNPAVLTIPSRLTYPQKVQSVNVANYNAAVALLSGGDKLTSRLWWMN